MKLHYAAALALTAWYLMVPIPGGTIGNGPFFNVGLINLNLPLSKWSTVKAFDMADDCQSVLGNWQGAAVYPNGAIDMYIPSPNHPPPSRLPTKAG
jgi:hypothetical protein